MRISIRLTGQALPETISDIASFLLHDPFGAPILIGLEYVMAEGTAWTLASADDADFHKILGTSGILHTMIPGCRPGTINLLCTPILRRGIPRRLTDVDAVAASTEGGLPFFLALKSGHDRFQGVFQHEPEFRQRWSELWTHR